MELKGKIIQELPLQTGMGKKGQWQKQEYVLETPGQYPKKVCIGVWGDKIDQMNLGVGDEVTVSIEIESREYNSRYYTEVRAWKCEHHTFGGPGGKTQEQKAPVRDAPPEDTDGPPF